VAVDHQTLPIEHRKLIRLTIGPIAALIILPILVIYRKYYGTKMMRM
jgi:hypothetical protein